MARHLHQGIIIEFSEFGIELGHVLRALPLQPVVELSGSLSETEKPNLILQTEEPLELTDSLAELTGQPLTLTAHLA